MDKWIIHKTKFDADLINPDLAVSPWSGHRQFAYDLTAFLKPENIVELGTHYGCSFFAFLQACKDFHLETNVTAIDCWQGDEQAGFYGEEVLDTVRSTINEKFSKQNSRLIQSYFADALPDFPDESIDVLHIDGLHTYEAVSEDYKSWLCKLKTDGIILFHDIASHLNYGTNKFWKEITDAFTCVYTFEHSWGLGVLFPKGNKNYLLFEENNMRDKVLIYEYSSMYELVHRQLQDHIVMVQERDKAIKANEALIFGKQKIIEQNEQLIKDKDKALMTAEKMIQERDLTIKANEKMIRERDLTIKANEEMIRERDLTIKANEEMIRERDLTIKADEEMIRERDRTIKANEEMIRARDEAIKSNEIMIQARDEAIKTNEEMIRARDKIINEANKRIDILTESINIQA